MTGNNLSTLGVKATQLTSELNFDGRLTWMPTTGEFGPRGALGDFEEHDKLATRFGVGYGVSRENRQSNDGEGECRRHGLIPLLKRQLGRPELWLEEVRAAGSSPFTLCTGQARGRA